MIDNSPVDNELHDKNNYINSTLKQRIGKNIVNLYNYNKFDKKSSSGRNIITGKALLNNMIKNLSVIDIDINKSLDNDTKDKIRNNILSKLSDDDIIVKTASGGLHIYCNTDEFYTTNNRMIKCYESNDYNIDIFSSVDETKRSLVVLPGSKVRKDHKSPVSTYEFIRGNCKSHIIRTVNDILKDLDIKITVEQPQEIKDIVKMYNDSDNITVEFARTLIHGLEGFEIHNDAYNRPLSKEITLYVLFQAINSLPNEVIDEAYDYVYNNCNLTPNAKSNYDIAKCRYMHLQTHYGVLIKIIKLYNEDYYKKFIKNNTDENIIHNIDLNDNFSITNISSKAERHIYKCYKDVIEDLSKVIRLVESNNLMFIIKTFDIHNNKYVIGYMTNTNMKELLKMIKLWKDGKRNITAYDAFLAYKSKLTVKGIKFYSNNEKDIFSIFQGYKYKSVDKINIDIISNFLNMIKEVIADNNNDVYNYLLNWISYIIQNPGKKTETAIVLKGLQGIGKNTFTDVICELLSGYSEKNINQIGELTGNFNSVVESKMLLVLNELKNVGEDRLANFDALKSIITDKTIRINEKNQPRRTSENVANCIFVTNNSYPIKIESDDRRYVVLLCNGKYKNNHDFWTKMYDSFTPEFYNHLLTYLLKRDINNYNPRIIPVTEAKQDLIEASRNTVEQFICDNYNKLCEGWLCSDALFNKPYEIKMRSFQLQLKDKCDRKRVRRESELCYCYFLKDEYKNIYHQTQDVEEDDND